MDTLCRIRDLQRAISEYEARFSERFGLCLNEGMLLCAISDAKRPLSSGEISEQLGLSSSNTSKVIASVEKKGLVERLLGEKDRRQMYFRLSGAGHGKLRAVNYAKLELPETLRDIIGEQ